MLLHSSIKRSFYQLLMINGLLTVLISNHTHLYNFSFIIIQNFGFEPIVAVRLNAYQPQNLQEYLDTIFTYSRKETSEGNSPFVG